MKPNQLNQGQLKRVMYIENKEGLIDGAQARIGWVTFSKTGKTIYYRDKTFFSTGARGVKGNYRDSDTYEEYWISGIKKRGSNAHRYEPVASITIDDDAQAEYERLKNA